MIAAQAEEAKARVPTLKIKLGEMKKMDAELDHLAQSENSVQFLQVLHLLHQNLDIPWWLIISSLIYLVSSDRNGPTRGAVVETSSSFSTRIHFPHLRSHREPSNSSGGNWRNSVTNNLLLYLQIVCVFNDILRACLKIMFFFKCVHLFCKADYEDEENSVKTDEEERCEASILKPHGLYLKL